MPGEAILSQGPVPEAPEVLTRHGRHLYFAGAKSLPTYRDLGPQIHLLGPGHYVELPPSPGKEWVRHVDGPLPRLPRHLLLLVKQRSTTGTAAGVLVDVRAELADWRELLGDVRGSGPWRARCPLHDDARASFSIFRGQKDGRLIGRCHAGCGTWTVRRLRHRLGTRLTSQYTQAHAAITALGDGIDPAQRDALRWVVRQAETFGLDLTAPEGIGASYRQLAAATGLEQVGDDGHLSSRGRRVVRLLDSLRALGIIVMPGTPYTPDGGRGAPTRLLLPAAWLTRARRHPEV
jgi:hypothetical protein